MTKVENLYAEQIINESPYYYDESGRLRVKTINESAPMLRRPLPVEDEKEAIAAGTKTREQVIEAKREEGVKALTAQFDAAIQKLQVEIRAIRGVAKPSEKRAAQLQSTLDLQRRIGEEGPLETAEEVATIAKTQRESRSGQTLVDVRTGRVTEGRMPSAAKALTEAQERREAIEANEISYRNSLLRYAATPLAVIPAPFLVGR